MVFVCGGRFLCASFPGELGGEGKKERGEKREEMSRGLP